MKLCDKLVPELMTRYATQGPIPGQPPDAIITLPARHAAFGDVEIFDDGHEATIFVGVFTHMHIDDWGEGLSEEARADRILDRILEWLDALFDDRVIAWGSHKGGGGCEWISPDETLEEHASRGEGWIWSGPWERSGEST